MSKSISMQYSKKLAPGTSISFRDGLAAAYSSDSKWLISSPNMSFIPELSMGWKTVCIRADGRYGLEDPTQWPQNIYMGGQWLAAIPRRPKDPNHRLQPIWENVTLRDFVPSGVMHALGTLSTQRQAKLQPLVREIGQLARTLHKANPEQYGKLLPSICSQMEEAFMRLDLPSTFRDIVQQVTCVQRHYLYTSAILTWYGDICLRSPGNPHAPRSDIIGAFSTDPGIVQRLFNHGVPVWYMRYPHQISRVDVLLSIVDLDHGAHIVTDEGAFGKVIYQGLIGSEQCFEAIARAGKCYLDVEQTPLLEEVSNKPVVSREPTSLVVRNQSKTERAQPYSRRKGKKPLPSAGRSKFLVPQHPWITGVVPVWAEALAKVDQKRPSPVSGDVWGYRIPEAFMVIGPGDKERQQTYIHNWLRLRDPLAYILSHPAHSSLFPPFNTQLWRTYLRYGPLPVTESTYGARTHTQMEKNAVVRIFRVVFGDYVIPDCNTTFFGELVPRSLEDIPLSLGKRITWDIHEMGFRIELQQLDRALHIPEHVSDAQNRAAKLAAIFPKQRFFPYPSLPDKPCGLTATDIKDRVDSLNALRCLMEGWRTVTRKIKNIPQLDAEQPVSELEEAEKTLVTFYVQEFFEASGRAAIIPLSFPVAS